MSLSAQQLKNICLLGHHDSSLTCRYLRNDELDSSKWHCQKLISHLKTKIDTELDNSLRNHKEAGMRCPFPSGDNCKGYPVLKNIIQGYDC
jgi:hypothetical protein